VTASVKRAGFGTAGVDIVSTVGGRQVTDDKLVTSYTGTAQAAANVVGVAALCLDALRQACTASGAFAALRGGEVVYDCIAQGVEKVPLTKEVTKFGGRVNARRTAKCCVDACPFSEVD
jgi:hypothetical protein